MIIRQACKVKVGLEGWLWAVFPYSAFLYLCGFLYWVCTCLQVLFCHQCCIWNLSIWNLGVFFFLSSKAYGIQPFVTWFPFVGHISRVADASQLVLSHTAEIIAAINWKVSSFLRYVLGYTCRADSWINVLAQVFNFVLHFYGSFFSCTPSFTALTLKMFFLMWERSSCVFLMT